MPPCVIFPLKRWEPLVMKPFSQNGSFYVTSSIYVLADMTADKRQNQANKTRAWSGEEECTGSFCTVAEREKMKPTQKAGDCDIDTSSK